MNKSIVLQILNGYLAVTALCGAFIFLRYLVDQCHLGYKELRPAIAILCMWMGEIILRSPIWWQRTLANAGFNSAEPVLELLIGGFVVEVAFLCMIRVFSPEAWRYWSWLGTLIISTVVVLASIIYVYWR